MLQNDPVRNLHFDSEIRVAQQPRLDPVVFHQPTHIITSQRRRDDPQSQVSPRIPLPISTIEMTSSPLRSTGTRTYIPIAGYDILADLPSVTIEQTFELNLALTSVASENRYIIRSASGEAIFSGSECSEANDRLLCGSARPFQLHILDKTNQEALLLRKNFATGMLCCQPKCLEVWSPNGGDRLGRIIESPSFLKPLFFIEDGRTGDPVFCIEGPSYVGLWCFCCMPNQAFFKINSGSDVRALIDRKWVADCSQYKMIIYFCDSSLNVKERTLILGSAFLLEYVYFQVKS